MSLSKQAIAKEIATDSSVDELRNRAEFIRNRIDVAQIHTLEDLVREFELAFWRAQGEVQIKRELSRAGSQGPLFAPKPSTPNAHAITIDGLSPDYRSRGHAQPAA